MKNNFHVFIFVFFPYFVEAILSRNVKKRGAGVWMKDEKSGLAISGVAYRIGGSNLLHANGWKFQDHTTRQLNLHFFSKFRYLFVTT